MTTGKADNRVVSFIESLRGRRIGIVGAGVSHADLIRLLVEKGASVTLCDRKKSLEEFGPLGRELAGLGVQFRLGEGYLQNLTDFEIFFRTPGLYFNRPELTDARRRGVAVTSELELFFQLCPCRIYAVTGSDGKTTTTSLIAEMLRREGRTVHLGGNIGRALLPIIEQVQPGDAAVVELSSFQLLSMRQSPDVAVVTNVTPNHLDVHKTMEEYIEAKKQILLHQNAFSRAVLNGDNDITRSFVPLVRGEVRAFSRRGRVERGCWLRPDGWLCWVQDGVETPVVHRDEIRIPGIHNVENFCTAISAVWGEVSPNTIRQVAREFPGVEHRIEFVREREGVRWYNDSIGTSPTRTMAGLSSFGQKLILLAGGYDKHIPYEPLAPLVREKVKALILMGATAGKIESAVRRGEDGALLPEDQLPAIYRVSSMEEAVARAASLAGEGDVVLLSPASASFDLYRNFEERGDHFKSLVNAL